MPCVEGNLANHPRGSDQSRVLHVSVVHVAVRQGVAHVEGNATMSQKVSRLETLLRGDVMADPVPQSAFNGRMSGQSIVVPRNNSPHQLRAHAFGDLAPHISRFRTSRQDESLELRCTFPHSHGAALL